MILDELEAARHQVISEAKNFVALRRMSRSVRAAGELWQEDEVVFARPDGRPLAPRQDWQEF